MVDLHAHSDRSDGQLSPEELVELARQRGLSALAITDHDSVEGYDAAAPHARQLGLDLICGVELNSKFRGRAIHVLGYFLEHPPGEEFRNHLSCLQKARRERNERLTKRLQQLGLSVHLEEAEALGKSQTGRPHFAQLLVQKGYATSNREAFDRYLDERAPGYVERRDPSLENVFRWMREAGAVSSWAHPARFLREDDPPAEELFHELGERGLNAIEAFHTDHSPDDAERFRRIAEDMSLGVTGGSDYHGPTRARGVLGSLNLPDSLLDNLRAYSRQLFSAALESNGA
jgi:predicted metal-dependent phosphoesterase TrpH